MWSSWVTWVSFTPFLREARECDLRLGAVLRAGGKHVPHPLRQRHARHELEASVHDALLATNSSVPLSTGIAAQARTAADVAISLRMTAGATPPLSLTRLEMLHS